jgi:hypothetical protein
VDGEFAHCYQLADLVYSAASDYTTKGYDTTPNNGGEYKVWISKEADFDPQKTDNFKVVDVVVPPAESLSVSKDATPSLDRTFGWNISKDVDKTTVKQIGGSATFNYTVKVSHDAGTGSDWKVTGDITVSNPNAATVTGVDLTDKVDNGGACEVTDGHDVSVPANESVTRSYTCTYPDAQATPKPGEHRRGHVAGARALERPGTGRGIRERPREHRFREPGAQGA